MKSRDLQITLVTILALFLYVSGDEFVEYKHSDVKFVPNKTRHTGIFDTFRLSLSGNLDFSELADRGKKIFEGVGKYIDLKVIKASVDFFFDKFFASSLGPISNVEVHYGPVPRNDIVVKKDGKESTDHLRQLFRNSTTTILGAILGKQQCWNLAACMLGQQMEKLSTKNLIFIIVNRVFPEKFQSTLDIVKQAANSGICNAFICDPDLDDKDFDMNKN